MPKSTKKSGGNKGRRRFLKSVTLGAGAFAVAANAQDRGQEPLPQRGAIVDGPPTGTAIEFPRIFSGGGLARIAFPLGGIGTGSISLGGRGELRDWEIFNRPDKGNRPDYVFPAIWVQANGHKPVARVLEAQVEPPYESVDGWGLGKNNVPGLSRLQSATFKGAFPFAWIDFHDDKLPVRVSLEAFNPLVPLDAEASGLPVAILRYYIKNPNAAPAKVGVSYSLHNAVGKVGVSPGPKGIVGGQSVFREDVGVSGLFMTNPFLSASDPLNGSIALCVLGAPTSSVSYLRGWSRSRWWDGALTFWDDFTADGALDSNSPGLMPVSSIAVTQMVPAGGEARVTFMIAWHFPNRTPQRCGWKPPDENRKNVVVGNYYTKRFSDAWNVSQHVARELPTQEVRTRKFYEATHSSTLPPAVLDAALSNLSTLVTNTGFRTADGEFHGFEGCADHAGCCPGSCTHVWNYEQATAFMFPSLAHSLLESQFLRNTMENGLMGFRSFLPDGEKILDQAAADGQMGCLIRLYRDWQLSGDTDWLRRLWPQAKRALEFAWIKNGWDGDRDGVMEGVQHNTYDVEFYGPNPLCGVKYLGALRAGEEMATAVGDADSAVEYRRLFENGKKWIDENLFNGEYYIQKIVPRKADEIAEGLRIGMGAADPLAPDYQMGDACFIDQVLGQYMAHVAGLGYLLDEEHIRKALQSLFRYNYKANLSEHDCVSLSFAVNGEAGVLIATYRPGKRPEIPFPYFAEVWNALEYQFAAHLIYEGMVTEGLTVIESVRVRHDGKRRNPWNEPACGHHYSRGMASWATLLALSGFNYSGVERRLTLMPRVHRTDFRSFWSAPSGWGSFAQTISSQQQKVSVEMTEGTLAMGRLILEAVGNEGAKNASARFGSETLTATLRSEAGRHIIDFGREIEIAPGKALQVVVRG
jgi:non-lysosomal glucosylceramidase